MTFLSAGRDILGVGAHEVRPGCGIMVPLPLAFLTILDQLGIFHLVRASSFDAARSNLAVTFSCPIDWSRIDLLSPFVNFDFERGCVYNCMVRGGRPRDTSGSVVFSYSNHPIPWKEGIYPAAVRNLTRPQRFIRVFFLKFHGPRLKRNEFRCAAWKWGLPIPQLTTRIWI